MLAESKKFFELPADVKQKYAKTPQNEHGWVSSGREYFDPDNPVGDSKECFNFLPCKDSVWSDETVVELRDVCRNFHKNATELALRILDVICLAFVPDHRDFFRQCHSQLGQLGNERYLRSLYYPPIVKGINDQQPGCGEHTDYGSLTVLWQDESGGLQIRNKDDKLIDAVPIPGTVLINIGDLMQRWTADKLVATRHRVVRPLGIVQTKKSRQSIAVFTGPNDDVLIECLDGSEKYQPVLSKDFYAQRYKDTYLY